MVDCRTIKGAEGGDLGRRIVEVGIRSKDDIPEAIKEVDFGCPDVG